MTASKRVQRVRNVKTEPEIVYYTMEYIASLMLDEKTGKCWQTQRARRWLLREGACFKTKSGRYLSTASMLVGNFADLLGLIQRDEAR